MSDLIRPNRIKIYDKVLAKYLDAAFSKGGIRAFEDRFKETLILTSDGRIHRHKHNKIAETKASAI